MITLRKYSAAIALKYFIGYESKSSRTFKIHYIHYSQHLLFFMKNAHYSLLLITDLHFTVTRIYIRLSRMENVQDGQFL